MADIIYKIKCKICEKMAGTYIETAFVLMAIMWLVALISAFLPIFAQINKINTYANHVARIISVEGGVTPSAIFRINDYQSKMQLDNVNLDYSKSDFFDGYKVQLNDEIVVETDTNYHFNIIGIPVNIPISTKAISRSEVYYK